MNIFILLLLIVPSISHAQMPDTLSADCRKEIDLHCPPNPSLREHVKCLKKSRKKFSIICKEELLRYTQLNRQMFTRMGGAMSSLGGLNVIGPSLPTLSYEGRWMGPDNGPTFNEHKLNLQMPVYRGEKDRLTLALSTSNLHSNEQIVLSSGRKIPTDLNRVETGLQYSHQLEEKRSLGLRGSVGYSGDKVFQAGNNFAYSLMGFYSFTPSTNGTWAATLFMTNSSFFGANVPIPGFLYFYRTETFTGVFGLPFASFQWTPSFPWSYTVSLFGPTLNSEVAYGSLDEVQFFAGAGWSRQVFMLSERNNDRDRLTIEEKKLQIGLRSPLFWKLISELNIGRSFDRALYIGQGFNQRDDGDKNLEAAWFTGWNIRVAF